MNYGLIGEKLGHSYSKIIHELIGLYEYDLKEIPKNELNDFILSKSYKGLNVTIPYKQDVIPMLDFIDDGAKSIGAVNTIANRDGKLYGYNTDYYGLKKLIEYAGVCLEGKKVLILGTGGTSKTAYAVAKDLKAESVIKLSRSAKDGSITYEEGYEKHSDAQVIINTTPCGMYPNILVSPVELDKLPNIEYVFDAIYNPMRTKLMLDAANRGIKALGGLRMLVYQAIVAAEHFTGSAIDETLVEQIYRTVRNESENIVLIGMPAVGKTTTGLKLAAELNMEFVDTDVEIVKREGREIPDIFKSEGEPYFRKIESEVIRDVAARKNTIIATGGGAILNPKNVEVLKSFGIVYLLHRDPNKLVPTGNRPLANDKNKIMKLYEERMPIYKKAADVTIDGENGLSSFVKMIKRYRNEH